MGSLNIYDRYNWFKFSNLLISFTLFLAINHVCMRTSPCNVSWQITHLFNKFSQLNQIFALFPYQWIKFISLCCQILYLFFIPVFFSKFGQLRMCDNQGLTVYISLSLNSHVLGEWVTTKSSCGSCSFAIALCDCRMNDYKWAKNPNLNFLYFLSPVRSH